MASPTPRVQAPAVAAKGEIFRVKALIMHPMETGLRLDDQGKVIPRLIINRFSCRYAGREAFSVELHEGMSANPFFEFSLRATQSGPMAFAWHEDGGAIYRLDHWLTVG